MTADRPPRILHAPLDVGGQAYGLSRAERELGLQSDVAVFSSGPFGYGTDIDLRAGIDRPIWLRFARRGAFLARSVRKYDLFHFNFGLTLLTVRQLGHVFDELRLLKRLGKTVFVTYQGSDVRPAAACPCRRPDCLAFDRYRQPAARRALRFADRVFYLNPDLREWLPGATFCPYASVDPREVLPSPEPESDEIVIAHAPTDVNVKGTRHVVAAIEALRSEGLPVRLDLIGGVSRNEVVERVRQAHVVVDQVLIGWYGGFAVEAMACGRPALAYIKEDVPEDNPFGAQLPIVRTTPETLADDLRALVTDPARRRRAAEQGRRFVEAHHDPRAVAREVLEGYAPALQAESGAVPASS
ncbi:MAG TPA: glycosyltransferase family 4 protein [Gaiellaceae bacterium]|nr:glycosyltransferase family 4 protein [Gaiellaceae bacterium]